ncbi:dephospho-CoA kinase [Thioalkalivibrio sp. XN8]|nr:dephospho-CoA kinase [Thioalkalivibrio sp. XN8]
MHIGLTGGIASGKSTVARLFAERGVPVIDTDQVARQVVEPGQPALEEITRLFGPEVLDADGRLDRAALRARVFRDEPARRQLEALLHPLILAATVQQVEAADGLYQVIVAPLLVEFGLAGWVDRVLVVDCPAEMQLERLMARDGSDEELARSILAAQASREQRLAAADDVITNDGPRESLEAAVAVLDGLYRDIARDGDRDRPGVRLP